MERMLQQISTLMWQSYLRSKAGLWGTTHWLVSWMVSPRAPLGMQPGGSATVVGAGVDGVGVVAGLRLCLERLGKSFGAGLGLPVHARRVGVVASATGPVEHVLGDGGVKTWLGLRIGELSGDDGVYLGRRAGFVLRSEVDEYVRV